LISVIFPICITSNPFWNSAKGLECINNFLAMVQGVEGIDQHIVVTSDDQIRHLARMFGMSYESIEFHSSPDRFYTFEETRSLAKNVANVFTNSTDTLIILDHRNLLLTSNDINTAIAIYREIPKGCVISLTNLKDYPCQFRSFSSFLGCAIMRFELSQETTHTLKGHGEITIRIVDGSSHSSISFRSHALTQNSIVAQLIPFDEVGPRYEQTRELNIPQQNNELVFDIESFQPKGFIFIFTSPSLFNEHDTVELFSPPNAPWALNGIGNTMINTKTNEPIHGRQQFPTAYTYDGSICILGVHGLSKKSSPIIKPIKLKNTGFVNDWLDYWHTISQPFDSSLN
jgi:hypothetical protein